MYGFALANFILLPILVVALFFLVSVILQWLWNITMPQVFALREINFWQAFRLLLIAGILFGASGIRFIN
ncbi:MAG: hypothetical protein AVO34_02790 [Firmicutes bacterium ML8_F2]|jgi:hypothetical protein|nr:MAG: hypothetical protein AVO34_02790 [Firmicutes bacterium ML8_F2]